MPLKSLHDRLRRHIPESLRKRIPSKEQPAPEVGGEEVALEAGTPASTEDDKPLRGGLPYTMIGTEIGTTPDGRRKVRTPWGTYIIGEPATVAPGGSGYQHGPHYAPSSEMSRVPEYAQHPEGHVQYNVGDPVEFDADPTGRGGADRVDAVHVAGPPKRMTREEILAGKTPYRSLEPGEVTVRNGARGTVTGIGSHTLMVSVPKHDVEITEGVLRKTEWRAIERLFDRAGGYTFGFDKQNIIPLKLEEERVWADGGTKEGVVQATTIIRAADLIPGGEGDDRPDSDFDAYELASGVEHEMEHTVDPDIAKEIAKDHLTEDPEYYKKLRRVAASHPTTTRGIAHDVEVSHSVALIQRGGSSRASRR